MKNTGSNGKNRLFPGVGQRDSAPWARLVARGSNSRPGLGADRRQEWGQAWDRSSRPRLRIQSTSCQIARPAAGLADLVGRAQVLPRGVVRRNSPLMSPSQNIPASAGPDGSELLLRRPHAANCLLGFVVFPLGSVPPFPETFANQSGNRTEVKEA